MLKHKIMVLVVVTLEVVEATREVVVEFNKEEAVVEAVVAVVVAWVMLKTPI